MALYLIELSLNLLSPISSLAFCSLLFPLVPGRSPKAFGPRSSQFPIPVLLSINLLLGPSITSLADIRHPGTHHSRTMAHHQVTPTNAASKAPCSASGNGIHPSLLKNARNASGVYCSTTD